MQLLSIRANNWFWITDKCPKEIYMYLTTGNLFYFLIFNVDCVFKNMRFSYYGSK